jgi:hypothetical protein
VTRRMGLRLLTCGLAALVAVMGVFCLPSRCDAQQAAPPRHIGVLLVGWSPESKEAQEFRQGLRDAGYAEGRDVVIEWRSAAGDYHQVPRLVADLVQRKIDVIVVETTLATRALKRATSTIPVVMVIVADPVGSGLVASLAHPGANVTQGVVGERSRTLRTRDQPGGAGRIGWWQTRPKRPTFSVGLRSACLVRRAANRRDRAGIRSASGKPADPGGDALHLALASYHRCDFLVTWNCRHLANANKFGHIRRVNVLLGLFVPALVTPLELLGDDDETDPQ